MNDVSICNRTVINSLIIHLHCTCANSVIRGNVYHGRCIRTSGIWRWAVPYEYLFLKILLPRQTGLLPRQKGL